MGVAEIGGMSQGRLGTTRGGGWKQPLGVHWVDRNVVRRFREQRGRRQKLALPSVARVAVEIVLFAHFVGDLFFFLSKKGDKGEHQNDGRDSDIKDRDEDCFHGRDLW